MLATQLQQVQDPGLTANPGTVTERGQSLRVPLLGVGGPWYAKKAITEPSKADNESRVTVMIASPAPDFSDVLSRITSWPPQLRIMLARPAKTLPVDQVIGVLKPEGPTPGDAECRQILEA